MPEKLLNKNIYDYLLIILISFAGLGSLPFEYSYLQATRVFSLLLIVFFFLFRAQKIEFKRNTITLIFTCLSISWVAWGLLSFLWTTDIIAGQKELLVISVNLLGIYVMIYLAQKSNQLFQSIFIGWLLALLYTIPISINEIIYNQHAAQSLGEVEIGGIDSVTWVYASAFFGNPNGYCAILVVISAFLFGKLLELKPFISKILIIILLIHIMTINMLDSARLGIVILFMQFGLYMLYQSKKVIISLSFLAIIMATITLSYLENNNQFLYNEIVNVSDPESTSERKGLLYSGISLFTNSYGLGVGAGGFEAGIAKCCIKDTEGQTNPHNLILEIGSQYGVVILLLFFLLLLICFNNAFFIQERAVQYSALAFIFSLPLMGLMNSALLEYNFFWIGLGCCIIVVQKYSFKSKIMI